MPSATTIAKFALPVAFLAWVLWYLSATRRTPHFFRGVETREWLHRLGGEDGTRYLEEVLGPIQDPRGNPEEASAALIVLSDLHGTPQQHALVCVAIRKLLEENYVISDAGSFAKIGLHGMAVRLLVRLDGPRAIPDLVSVVRNFANGGAFRGGLSSGSVLAAIQALGSFGTIAREALPVLEAVRDQAFARTELGLSSPKLVRSLQDKVTEAIQRIQSDPPLIPCPPE